MVWISCGHLEEATLVLPGTLANDQTDLSGHKVVQHPNRLREALIRTELQCNGIAALNNLRPKP